MSYFVYLCVIYEFEMYLSILKYKTCEQKQMSIPFNGKKQGEHNNNGHLHDPKKRKERHWLEPYDHDDDHHHEKIDNGFRLTDTYCPDWLVKVPAMNIKRIDSFDECSPAISKGLRWEIACVAGLSRHPYNTIKLSIMRMPDEGRMCTVKGSNDPVRVYAIVLSDTHYRNTEFEDIMGHNAGPERMVLLLGPMWFEPNTDSEQFHLFPENMQEPGTPGFNLLKHPTDMADWHVVKHYGGRRRPF